MTLKGHYVLCFKTHASFGAHCENLNEDRSILSATRCSPMTLVSASERFAPIFEGFIGERASNDCGVIENMDFHGFRRYVFSTLRNETNVIIYYNRKKLQFITLLKAIMLCFTHRKQQK